MAEARVVQKRSSQGREVETLSLVLIYDFTLSKRSGLDLEIISSSQSSTKISQSLRLLFTAEVCIAKARG